MLHYEIQTKSRINIFSSLKVESKINTSIEKSTYSCVKYLSDCKELIEQNSKAWDVFKKHTNPYEWIHTMNNNKKVSKLRPLSRAFYKLLEMMQFFSIVENNMVSNPIKTYHLAEGPGGFIEAVKYYRKNTHDLYYGMTLINDSINVPGWIKARQFIEENRNVIIEYGATKDGNLYSLKNLDHNYLNHKEEMDLVTGDGGFDFSNNFNNQEATATKLILSEILHGLVVCKPNGTIIVKCFDLFTTTSYQTIYFLSTLFKEMYICKPETSRYGNSEKYIVCKNKLFTLDDSIYQSIKRFFIQIQLADWNDKDISILNLKIPSHIKNNISEMNCMFTERQLNNINDTLVLIENSAKRNEKMHVLKEKHILMSTAWCKKYNVPFNNVTQNMFMKCP